MKLKRKIAVALLCMTVIFTLCPAGIAEAAEVNTYTYNYDYWGLEYESPDAYRPTSLVTGGMLGITEFKTPQGMYIRGDRIYIVDTGNNRIVEIQVQGKDMTVVREIAEFKGDAEVTTFRGPNDVFVAENGDFYIADTDNMRVVHIDNDLNLVKIITQPSDVTVDQSLSFLPTKIVADRAGRAFVLVRNVNKGFMEFEADGEFIGYIGANQVVFKWADYLMKLFSTQAQRDRMDSFTPTEYNNLYIDGNGFVYCTTSVFEEWAVENGDAKPIRKLNSLGTDILIRNAPSGWTPVGDWQWDNAGGMNGPSRLVDITAFDNEIYYVIDRVRGRIFGYDEQGNLLYAFGGPGNKLGYFQMPVAIDHMGDDLYVLDSVTGGITKFQLTEFGTLIKDALAEYRIGEYTKSAEYWNEVLKMNGNYELAYIGIGRSYLQQKNYVEAMKYFKVKHDHDNYSRAWKYYRREWIENNMGYVMLILVILIVVPAVVKSVKKVRKEAQEEHEHELELSRKGK